MTEKLIRDGKVAVIYSPGYGAGWSTWFSGNAEAMVFSPRLALAILGESGEDRNGVAKELFGGAYSGGLYQAKVHWVPSGQAFQIEEYDGSESIIYYSPEDYMIA